MHSDYHNSLKLIQLCLMLHHTRKFYHKDNYFRIYFQNKKGKTNCDNIINQHDYILFNPKTLDFSVSKTNKEKGLNQFAGPLWSGSLMDKSLLKKMVTTNHFPEEKKFLEQLSKEKDLVGFFDVHILAKKYKKSKKSKRKVKRSVMRGG